MTAYDRIREDEAQMEYIKQWKQKRETKKLIRKFYTTMIINDIGYLWKNIKAYMKGI